MIQLPIYRFYPLMAVYVYYLDGLLIDTGPRLQKRHLVPIFNDLAIEKVALTHQHRDHCGLAKWLSKNLHVPIYAHKIEKRPLTLNEFLFIVPLKRTIEPYPEKIVLPNYEIIPVHTPGHTREHTCYYEPNEGWLFTGDLYITPEPKVSLRTESFSKYIDSLKTILALDFDTIFCAHQGRIEKGKEKIAEKLAYLEEVQSEAVHLYEKGYTERVIADQLFPKKARLERLSFGFFSSQHLIRQLIRAHNKHV